MLEHRDAPADVQRYTEQLLGALWEAYTGHDPDAHRRMFLVECIREARRAGGDPPTEDAVHHARYAYGQLYPDEAARLDTALLTEAVTAWTEKPGRPAKGTRRGKWEVLADLFQAAGIASTTDPEREWRHWPHSP
jgi:hypothetical protein